MRLTDKKYEIAGLKSLEEICGPKKIRAQNAFFQK